MMFSILTQLGCCSKAVTSKWPRWRVDTVIISEHVFLPLASSSCHLGFIYALCIYSDLFFLAHFTSRCLCFAHRNCFYRLFITIDALWKYLEYFCKPVATCRTVGALKGSVKIHVFSEALSQRLSLVYIFPWFSSFHIIPVISTRLSLSALNIQAFFSLPKNVVFQVNLNWNLVYKTHIVIIYSVCGVWGVYCPL